jgi:hypothetical protein
VKKTERNSISALYPHVQAIAEQTKLALPKQRRGGASIAISPLRWTYRQ